MGNSKNNPATWDCYKNAEPDEPMFIVLARDKDAPLLVRMWALLREQAVEMGSKPPKDLAQVAEARQCAYEMERWRRNNRSDERQVEFNLVNTPSVNVSIDYPTKAEKGDYRIREDKKDEKS